jgi:N6-L-threonylcarbamoyladenine synthase
MSKKILAIETSCDETSASVLKDHEVLSNIISSQEFHSGFGGIVPELASRAHIEIIDLITKTALKDARTVFKDIELIAATAGPGLIGSLLIGFNYAKSLAVSGKIPFIGIDHIESHLYSPFIGEENIEFPFISLIVSGGHTLLIIVKDHFDHKLLGRTVDDAAGEAFDKGAKMLGLGYPGGPQIDNISKNGNEDFYKFPVSIVKDSLFDFSFSGIKTSLLYYLRKNYPDKKNIPISDICASYQKAIIATLTSKVMSASEIFNIKNIAVSGGVSMNSKLRAELNKLSGKGYKIFFPKALYTTDNAAMIGYTAYLRNKFEKNESNDIYNSAFARLDYSKFNVQF